MNVAVDARNLIGSRTGVGRYLQKLLEDFTEISDDSFFIYSHDVIVEKIEHDRYHYKVLSGHPLVWKQLLMPVHQLRYNYDLVFVPTYSSPVFYPGKVLLTIHDLIFTKHPEWANWKQAVRFRAIVPKTAKFADRIIAVSEATRKDIIELTGVSSTKIDVVYLGVEDKFRSLTEDTLNIFRDKYNIRYPYILHVGSIHPRRNIKRLCQVFRRLKEEKKINHHLVLAGLDLDHTSQLSSYLELPDIHWVGYVPEEDLVGFFNAADLFIYPSLYEGFGLPVLEAMACGTPVITSNVSSLPEVAGDAALLIEPDDEEDMMRAISRILSEKSLAREMAEKGLERSKQYTWEKTSEQTLQIIQSMGS